MSDTALRVLVAKGMYAPSGAPICSCHNINAVKAGMEVACWHCQVRALLADHEGQP